MWIIVSNTKGEPPTCGCKHGDKPPPPRVMVDEWIDLWPQLILVGIKTHSLQIFIELPDFVRGYDYDWKLFSLCALFGEKEWFSVHVDRKDIISPCADIRNKKASAAFGGKEHIMGPSVQKQMVLCPKDLATNLINCKRPPLNEWSFVTNL
ncbi:Cytosolic motility family protein [Brugia pahangi]